MFGFKQLISQFADDTDLFLKFDYDVLQETIEVLYQVECSLGLKVNYDKTTVYRIGSIANSNAFLYTRKTLTWTNDPINILGVIVSNSMEVQELNFSATFKKMKMIINSWSNRILTLSGKVLLVNSLIASLFVYKLQVLPTLHNDYRNRYVQLVLQFLWGDKKPKIPFDILTKSRECGGLRLADLSLRDASLKAQWVRIIKDNDFFFSVADNVLGNYGVLIWFANLNTNHIKQLFASSFWCDVLLAWSKYNFHQPNSHAQVLQQIIWLNSNICVHGRPVCFKEAYQAGIGHVVDIYQNGAFLSYQAVRNKYGNCISWLKYYQLVSSIGSTWGALLINPNIGDVIMYRYVYIKSFGSICNTVYNQFITDKTAVNRYWESWNREINFTYDSYIKSFENNVKVTIATKYRDFQYRFLLRKTLTNSTLYHYGMAESKMCTFCNERVETLVHLFFMCEVSDRIWQSVIQYVNDLEIANDLDYSIANRILNCVSVKPAHIVNCLILVTKQYLFRCKCNKTKPEIDALKAEFILLERIEHRIAIQTNRFKRHSLRWNKDYVSETNLVNDTV